MSGIRVNSFVNQAVPSIAPDIKKDGEKNTSNWKAYAAAGTAITGIAFAAGRAWSANSMNSDVIDIKDLSQQVYSACSSTSLKPELQETVDKVRDIVVDVLADKKITNDDILKAVITFAKEIDPMLSRFSDASSVEIALLSSSESIWDVDLWSDECNDIIKQVFENSCKELNVNCNELTQTLANRFNNSTINEDVRGFIDHNRDVPCQYPYCENWVPPLPESIQPELREKANVVRSIILDLFAENNIKHDDLVRAMHTFVHNIKPFTSPNDSRMQTRFVDASPEEIVLLSALEGIKKTSLPTDQYNNIGIKVFERSCMVWNLDFNGFFKTLPDMVDKIKSRLHDEVRKFIDHNLEDPCQDSCCENSTPAETGNSATAIPGKETPAPGFTITDCTDGCEEDIQP